MKKSETEPMAYGFLAGALVLLLSLVAVQTGCGSARPRAENAPSVAMPAVAKLMILRDGKPLGQCTAWKASASRVVTAGHCCDPQNAYIYAPAPITAGIPGMTLEMLVDDDVHDICVLKGEMEGLSLPLADRDPEVGAYVWTAGFPSGWLLVSSGYWSGRDADNYGICSVVAVGGSSGSPVMNEDGLVIGVLVAGLRSGDNVTFTAPLEWLRADLEQSKTR